MGQAHNGSRTKNSRSRLSPEELSKRMVKIPHALEPLQAEGLGSTREWVLSCRSVWAVMKQRAGVGISW